MDIFPAHELSTVFLWICPSYENMWWALRTMSVSFHNSCESRAAQSSLETHCSIQVWTKIHCWCKLAACSLAFFHCKPAEKGHSLLSGPFSSQNTARGYLCFQENWKEQFNLSYLSQEKAVINRKALVRDYERIWGFQRANIVPF